MPAMHMNMARNFHIPNEMADFYEERAKGGTA